MIHRVTRSSIWLSLTGAGVLWLSLLGCVSAAEEKSQPVYSVGIVPQQSATKLASVWVPILEYLGERSGIKLRFRTAPNIPAFEKRLSAGEYDFAYMNPYHYTVFHETPGYVAFAHAADQPIHGIVVVRKDSHIEDLQSLDGTSMAFPAPAAFAASVLPRAYLSNAGITVKPVYVSSHDSVYRSVAKGLYPAGGGVMRTLRAIDPAISGQLRILWTTEGYTPHALAAHPDIPIGIVDRVQRALLHMGDDERGRALLELIKIPTGFTYAHDSAWDDVRGLGIDLLDEPVK